MWQTYTGIQDKLQEKSNLKSQPREVKKQKELEKQENQKQHNQRTSEIAIQTRRSTYYLNQNLVSLLPHLSFITIHELLTQLNKIKNILLSLCCNQTRYSCSRGQTVQAKDKPTHCQQTSSSNNAGKILNTNTLSNWILRNVFQFISMKKHLKTKQYIH